ncbi:sodium-dependent glucose transporter 1A-like isoform X1 [Clavelina lepadiformis]|uniref:sodium-dependent glucose transporter 1A-like isoform X1 n=1 Tax=Clavelina lepadiformis TaxID=159417 RepID=UPI004042526D
MKDFLKKDDFAKKEVSKNLLGEDSTAKQDATTDDSKREALSDFPRYLWSVALGAGFFGMGLTLAILGLALPTLAANLNLTIDDLSLVLIARGGGYIVGSFIAGILESKFDFHILAALSLLVMGIGVVLTPVILNVTSFYICTSLSSLGMGGYETVANVLCLYLWGKKSEPVLQFLHFWFCFGSAMTPFLSKSFLNQVVHNASHSISINSSATATMASSPNITYIENTTVPLVSVPYFIIAGFLTLVIISLILLKFFASLDSTESQDENTIEQEGTRYRYGMLILLFWLFFFMAGFQVTIFTFLYKFGITESPGLAYSRDVSADLNAMFFITVVVGQFLAIFWSQKFSPAKILTADFIGVGIGSVLLLLYPLYFEAAPILFWITIGLIGFSATSVYACIFLWANRYITINGSAAAVFIFGVAVGEMVLPIPVGFLINEHVLSFLYFTSGYSFTLILIFLLTVKFAHTKGQRLSQNNPVEEDKLKAEEYLADQKIPETVV